MPQPLKAESSDNLQHVSFSSVNQFTASAVGSAKGNAKGSAEGNAKGSEKGSAKGSAEGGPERCSEAGNVGERPKRA